MGLDGAAAGIPHVAEDEDKIDGDTEVSRDEALVVKVHSILVDENIEVLSEADKDAEEEADGRTPEALRRDVGKLALWNVLGLACADEVEMGNEDGDPGEQTEDCGEVDKVSKNLGCIVSSILLSFFLLGLFP